MQTTMLLTNKAVALGQARAVRGLVPVVAKPAVPRRHLAGRVRAEQVWQYFHVVTYWYANVSVSAAGDSSLHNMMYLGVSVLTGKQTGRYVGVQQESCLIIGVHDYQPDELLQAPEHA